MFLGTWIVSDSSKALTATFLRRGTTTPINWTGATSLVFQYRRTGKQASPQWTDVAATASGTPTDGTATVYPGTIGGLAPSSTGSQKYECRFKGIDVSGFVYFAPDGDPDIIEIVT